MKRSSTRAPVAASAALMASAGLWLIPFSQRTKSITIPVTACMAMPSWPAPLGRRRTPTPSAAMARSIRSISRGAQAATPISCRVSLRSTNPRRLQMASNSAQIAATARSRFASTGARASMVNRAWPGITLIAPGSASSLPTVATSSGSAAAMRSTASTHSAAAASASRRRFIGTVPA